MSTSHEPRGAEPGDLALVRMDTKMTPELNNTLNELVLAAGVSNASLVCAALALNLRARGALPPNHPDAAAVLQALTEKHRHEMEAVYWRILLRALALADGQRLWWADLTDPAAISKAVGRVEASGWLAALEAL